MPEVPKVTHSASDLQLSVLVEEVRLLQVKIEAAQESIISATSEKASELKKAVEGLKSSYIFAMCHRGPGL